MLPRRCKKCRCYVAPQLTRCPRCNAKAAPIVVVEKPTKEDKATERDAHDAKLPTIKSINMKWVPSAFSMECHRGLLEETKRKLDKVDTARGRNALRSEIRLLKRYMARADGVNPAKRWTNEFFRTKKAAVCIFISPKGKRYVLASRDGPATLRIKHRKRQGMAFSRLLLFEKSPYARMVKEEKKDAVIHTKRKRAKKERRIRKRSAVPTLL